MFLLVQDMFTKIKNNQNGFSNVDIILGILILIFVLPTLLYVVRDINEKSVEYELTDNGTIFANTIMHYISGFRFDENYGTSGEPWTYPLGQDGGDYDDIDDFIGADWSIIPGFSSSGYIATSNIFYVDPTVDLTTYQNYQTNFKRIVVTVDHSKQLNPITISTIITAHEF